MKFEYAMVAGMGIFFVALGIILFVYFFTVKQIGENFLAGIVSIFFGVGVLKLTIPVFIPPKKKTLPIIRTCPYCGAIAHEDASLCKKCNQQLD